MLHNHLIILICTSSFGCWYGAEAGKVIIDTDAGSDDAVAIFLTLAIPNVEVVAITCVYGNTEEANVETNVLKILTVANRSDIPVYGGAARPLLENYTDTGFFGKDGLGDVEFDRKIVGNIDKSKIAPVAMIDLVKKYPGEINVLTLGSTTNVALAASLDPNFTTNVKRFFVMGSTINDSISDFKEFNFGLDPESNAIFLNSTKNLKAIIVPKDAVMKHEIPKEWRIEILGRLDTEVINFMNKIEEVVFKKLPHWSNADPLTASLMMWPDLITSKVRGHMWAKVAGPERGLVSFDQSESNHNVEVVRDFNVTGFQNKLLEVFGSNKVSAASRSDFCFFIFLVPALLTLML